ncbi:flagellar biosynthesis protein FlhB [Oribacterium sp. oral taxon 102]|uniref:flagellar biosynthesis protein FlhB n=1 Tax=Oribacterium sp. oral taxon 102 TaxID=671214 RepID=UPI0015BE507B|nr:flagellar biosynthesis protein FlhB [Oribacterium sp. oral taxon 102]
MAGEEKTEAPTAKKRGDAKKEGNVFQSRDAVTVVMVFGMFTAIRWMLPYIYGDVGGFFIRICGLLETEQALSAQLFYSLLFLILRDVLPLLLLSALFAVLANGAQTRFNVSFTPLRPKLSRLSPASGLKRVFSMKNLVELLKNILKITILLVLLYTLLKEDVLRLARMLDTEVQNAAVLLLHMIYDLVIRVAGVFLLIAFFDYLYQRWQYEQDLRMTKQEVKDEFKQTEGNPEIKSRIRSLQRQRSQMRMMQQVPEADVIIRNPTHLAIALKYDPEKQAAPLVLAKGADILALRIVSVAGEHGIPAIENRELARAMYPVCEPGREIPAEFYGAVAEILVYIYRQQNREDLLR